MVQEDAAKGALAFILNPSDAPHSPRMSGSSSDSPTLSPLSKSAASEAAGAEAAEDEDIAEEEARLSDLHIGGRSLLTSDGFMEKRVTQLLSKANHHGKMRIRKSSICAQSDCGRAAVSRGRCVRHGVRSHWLANLRRTSVDANSACFAILQGGSRCTYPNCTHGARLYNRCFHHGGCKLCKVAGCTSKAKRYGYCWSHGGGM